jgi:branched-chain amino acid transport system substrate-binding protein
MMVRPLLALVLVAALVPAARTQAADPYELHAILPLTGVGAFGGQMANKTLGALEPYINKTGGIRGRPIKFVIHDDQSNPANDVQIVNQILSTSKPAVMIGSPLGTLCQAVASLVQRTGPVYYCYSPVLYPPSGSFAFTGGPATTSYALAFFRYFKARGWTRYALLTLTDATGQDADVQFGKLPDLPEFKNSDLKLVAHEHFAAADLSVNAQLARIKAANPQALIAISIGTPFGTVVRGIHEAGMGDLPIFATAGSMSIAQLHQFADLAPKQLYFPGYAVLDHIYRNKQEKAAQDRFYEVEKLAGIVPDGFALGAFDPTMVAVDALRAIGPDATAEQVRAYLANLHDYYGAYGLYDLRDGSQRGISPDNIVVERWDPVNERFVAVSDFGGRNVRKSR